MTARILIAVLAMCAMLPAQIITGTVTGRVVDQSGASVSTAEVVLTHPETGRTRTLKVVETGEFIVAGLDPGDYALSVTNAGFKRYERQNIRLESGQRLPLGDVVMQLGEVAETVSVTAEMGSVVATQSAERSDLISSRQVDGLLNLGRNVTALVQLMPGVVLTRSSDALGRTTDFNVNGSRRTMNNVSIDGLPSTDVGNAFELKLNVSQDAVAEVKVLLSNYQAEYGRMAGSNVSIITKSGTRDFHGLVSYYKRHEQFNANSFFNNLNGQQKPRYRYNAWTYNLGGPVYIPNVWNQQKNKAFVFWSQEFWPTRQGLTGSVTVPTALERAGNFSQSVDLNGALIVVRDPQAGASFPGNRIPAQRLDPNGAAILKRFPEPNFTNVAVSRRNYNYIFATEASKPTHTNTLKADYLFNERNTLVFSYNGFYEHQAGPLGITSAASNWPQWDYAYDAKTTGLTGRYTRVFTPTLINEVHVGFLHLPEGQSFEEGTLKANQRDTAGYNAPSRYPGNNPLGLLPSATFAGVPSFAQLAYDGRFPLYGITNLVNIDEKLTWIRGKHTMKAGVYYEWFQRDIGQPVSFAGALDFGRNVNNALDTGYAYSNAALGVFNAYSEASGRPYPQSRSVLMEFFAQDNWRVTPRLTLDLGARFSYMPPIVEKDNLLAGFVPDRYDRSKRVSLITPALDASGRRVGVNPVNGQSYPASLIGAIAPGSGDPANGMVLAAKDTAYPRALTKGSGIRVSPRIGFAYDLFGNQKTAIRGGFGLVYQRPNFGDWLRPFSAQPPLVQTPVVNFGTISTLATAGTLLSPTAVLALDPAANMPSVMNFSLSVQQNLTRGTVLDVGYVGSLARHLMWRRPLNPIPLGSNFDPRNADPTQRNVALQPAFLRPIVGYNNIDMQELAGSSNYHSLQVTLNRRFSRGLQLGTSYTWSKAMDYTDAEADTISAFVPVRQWNYGLASFDRTQNLKVNWLWDVPEAKLANPVLRQVINGWQVSGIASFVSGAPITVGYSTTTPVDITGSPTETARIAVVGNPVLAAGERTFYRNFDPTVFRLPARGTLGTAGRWLMRGPGTNNWDVAVFKNFPVHERLKLQFRSEMYNAWNHTQFTAWDTAARFNPATGEQVNARLGQATAAASPRVLQFSLRASF